MPSFLFEFWSPASHSLHSMDIVDIHHFATVLFYLSKKLPYLVSLDLNLLLIKCKFMLHIDAVMIIVFSEGLKDYLYQYS